MLRWTLLITAGSLLVLGLFTVVRAPAWSPWKLAVLAGEFGHGLAVIAIMTALAAWFTRSGAPVVALVTAALSVAAAVLLLVPLWQAGRIARNLPSTLEKQFGKQATDRDAFSIKNLFGRVVEPVATETLLVREGLPLDFYRPVRADGQAAPCVVVVHGGGWDGGDRSQLPELNHWLARRGYAVAAISYRLAPKHRWPAQLDDVRAALDFLRDRAPALGIDPGRLVLMGRSAGGQIAQMAGYTAGEAGLRGVIAFYAPSDLYFGYVNTHENDMLKSRMLMRQFLGGPPESFRANYDAASALNFVSPRSPPTLLLHGRNDPIAWDRHSERLAARLADFKVPHAYVALPWATHAFDYNLRGPGGQLTTFAIDWFLAAVTQ